MVPLVLLAAAAGLSACFYARFPERVASHWNFSGEVDAYAGRGVVAFGMPAVMILMYLLFLALPSLDPKRERYGEFARVYRIFRTSIIGLLFVLYVATGLFNLGYPVKIGLLAPGLIGLLFIVIGNYLGKVKNNWFMGIRTPWTLSSENVWNRTHRFGGRLFVIFGLVVMAAPFLPETAAMASFFGGVALLVLGTLVYSYVIYAREQKEGKAPPAA